MPSLKAYKLKLTMEEFDALLQVELTALGADLARDVGVKSLLNNFSPKSAKIIYYIHC